MVQRRVDAASSIALLPRGCRVLVAGASGESCVLAEAIMAAGASVAATFTGIFVPGINRTTYLPNEDCRVETFFMTAELAKHPKQVDFLPLCYQDILNRLRDTPIDAALMMVSPPDENGNCSFGPAVDFLAELWPKIPLRIGHINPLVPRTSGPGIPIGALHRAFEHSTPLVSIDVEQPDAVTDRIANAVATLIPNGATIQTGLGKVPGAILRSLTNHRNLRIHSGLIGNAVVDLAAAGALASGNAVTAGVAIGSQRLYSAIESDTYQFRPASFTHDATTIAAIPRFVSINSAMEVDLFGQAYAEVGPRGAMSGPGGASDFARAARLSQGGLRIVALPSDAAQGSISRIVAPFAASGPVSLSRFDIDIVVTEHGAADMRGLGHEDRAAALIRIAAPAKRNELQIAWATCSNTL